MNTQRDRPRPLTRHGRPAFRPEIHALEARTMMAGDGAASAGAAKADELVATSIFLGEVTTLLAGQPLPDRVVNRIDLGLRRGSLTRESALQQILRTPQVQAGVVENLAEKLLDRGPTPAESRTLVGGMLARGADLPWAALQIMSGPEYFRNQAGGTAAVFVQSATSDLLHRPASADELARAVPVLVRGGAAARSRFLRTMIGGEEFRRAQTRDVYEQLTGTPPTLDLQAAFLRTYRGPLGQTKMVAQVLQSAATSTGIIPTLATNPGLSVKRVPGFLAGWTVPNLAAPYDIANNPDRSIDGGTVDYWAITLNKLDSVILTIVPTDNPANTDFAVRIWGPDNKPIGTSVTGAVFTYVAATTGTYVIGISTKGNAGYAFNPQGTQPTPSGPTLRTFTAEFQEYPGANTDAVQLLLNYKNPAYTDDNWPAWTAAHAQAYQTLTMIASANAQVFGDLKNFTDFRQVGNQVDPQEFVLWLSATWGPFQAMLDDVNNPDIIKDTFDAFPVIQTAYGTVENFATQVANAFVGDPATQTAFVSVHQLLQGANVARADIYAEFLQKFESWSTSNEVFLGQDPTLIAALMTSGLTEVPAMSSPVDRESWLERLLSSIVALGAGLAGLIGGPPASLGVSAAGNLIVNAIDAWLDGDFNNPKPPPPAPSRIDIQGAAEDMQNTALESYKNTFDLLTNAGTLSSIFSNFGLLEAMGTMQFTYASGDQITPAVVLKDNYDRSIWEQLLPRMFSWKLVPFTDTKASTVPEFTGFIPSAESTTWENAQDTLPLIPPTSGWYSWDWVTKTWIRPPANVTSEARSRVIALQDGTPFQFLGSDFTPNDWFGPGPISTARTLTGKADRFYAIATNAQLKQGPLWRELAVDDIDNGPTGQWWKSNATIDGLSIQEWALETPDGKNGFLELSQDAADALFGAIPAGGLVPTGAGFTPYTGGLYVDYQIPAGGLATRFDVFSNWGAGIKGFSPTSFQPPNVSGSLNVGLNPNNQYSAPWFNANKFYNQYAVFTLTYGAKSGAAIGRPQAQPPGLGPGRGPTSSRFAVRR